MELDNDKTPLVELLTIMLVAPVFETTKSIFPSLFKSPISRPLNDVVESVVATGVMQQCLIYHHN
jgi:hypothetical protein